MEKSPDELAIGETYTMGINRISNSGNAIVEFQRGHINLGEASDDLSGHMVRFRYNGSRRGDIIEDMGPSPREKMNKNPGKPIHTTGEPNLNKNGLANNYNY